ncbi:hypothetical protein [Streptomyces inusitatus]|uniref:hypothetical protein n=1 Tax=Streptomyces inusitatus TaxID=68221 RepID=UPI00167DC72A|nr:hypothetical protein [Streptomyces inusitatus]
MSHDPDPVSPANPAAEHYAYRVRRTPAELTLIWRGGEGDGPDEFAVDGSGRLLTFRETAAARKYCERAGLALAHEDESEDTAALDLDPAAEWAAHGGPVAEGLLLDAWNLFTDLAQALPDGPPLPPRDPVQDSAYEKFFGLAALDPDGGDGAWDQRETESVREVLNAGLRLWETALADAVIQ